jgi:ubiquinol-cytochrome c reductase cytochrome c1 subunit
MAFFSSRILKTLAAAALVAVLPATGALAAGDSKAPRMQDWSFAGIFGTYDTAQLQRGFQVYTENCSACHALSRIAFRNLMEPGGPAFSEAEVRAIAANYFVVDGPDRSATCTSVRQSWLRSLPAAVPEPGSGACGNNGRLPTGLFAARESARADPRVSRTSFSTFSPVPENGPDYIYSLLTGYEDPPEGEEAPLGLNYNPISWPVSGLRWRRLCSRHAVEYDRRLA